MKKYIFSMIFIVLSLFTLSGCGGGNGSLKSGIGFIDAITPDAKLAIASNDNANELIDTLIGYNIDNLVPRSRLTLDKKKKLPIIKVVLNEINRFDSGKKFRLLYNKCDEGELNYIRLNDTEDEYQYRNCLQNGYYYNGNIVKKREKNILEIRYVTDFTIKSDYTMLKVYKNSKIKSENLYGGIYKISLDLVTNQDGKKSAFKEFEFIYDKDNNTIYYTKGIVYLNNLKEYVIYDENYDMSTTPLVYDENNNIVDGEFYFDYKNYKLHVIISDGVVDYEWVNY